MTFVDVVNGVIDDVASQLDRNPRYSHSPIYSDTSYPWITPEWPPDADREIEMNLPQVLQSMRLWLDGASVLPDAAHQVRRRWAQTAPELLRELAADGITGHIARPPRHALRCVEYGFGMRFYVNRERTDGNALEESLRNRLKTNGIVMFVAIAPVADIPPQDRKALLSQADLEYLLVHANRDDRLSADPVVSICDSSPRRSRDQST